MGLLTAGTGTISASFTVFWDPASHTGSPCSVLVFREMLSLTVTWYVMFY